MMNMCIYAGGALAWFTANIERGVCYIYVYHS